MKIFNWNQKLKQKYRQLVKIKLILLNKNFKLLKKKSYKMMYKIKKTF